MRYGYMMGSGYGGMLILLLLLVAAVVILYLLMRDNRQSSPSPQHELIIEILKHRYVTNQISADQYVDMKRIVEAETGDSPEMLALKEQYARGEVSTEEYWQGKNELK